MPRRPLIGVTMSGRGDLASYLCIVAALWLAGARTARVTAGTPREDLILDGLLLGGGGDIHPELFATAPKHGYAYDRRREAMELAWIRRARAQNLPVLGICRGAQLLNVAAGGGLHMDLAAAFSGTRYPSHWFEKLYFRKHAALDPASRLAAIIGPEDLRVNSIHSQAVDSLGEGLRVSARERNGAIQAIEDPARPFWLGLQFHPEFLFYRRRFRAVFAAFVRAAADHAGARAAPAPRGARRAGAEA